MSKVALGSLICFLALVAATMPAQATVMVAVDCSSFTNFAQLQGAGSCTLGSGASQITFSNFSFTPSATGTGTLPVNTQLTFSIDNGSPASPPSTDTIWGFEFNPNMTAVGTQGSEDIRISYTITTATPLLASIHLFMTGFAAANATSSVVEADTCAPPGVSCTPNYFVTPTAPHNDLEGIGPYTSIQVSKDINVTWTNSAIASISGVRDAVDLSGRTSGVPEPATISYLLGGAGLLGLGWIRRRSAKR